MKRKMVGIGVGLLVYVGAAFVWGRSGVGEFDRLADVDRKAFEERFKKEVWPLLSRNGKDGCVGCHGGKMVTTLKLTGDASKDYHFLLKEGFFLWDDKGSLLGRVTDTDKTRRMPKHPREGWKEEDIQVLRKFTMELDKKQKR